MRRPLRWPENLSLGGLTFIPCTLFDQWTPFAATILRNFESGLDGVSARCYPRRDEGACPPRPEPEPARTAGAADLRRPDAVGGRSPRPRARPPARDPYGIAAVQCRGTAYRLAAARR